MSTVPRLHLIGPLAIREPVDYVQVARRAVAGGCDAVHVRLPGAPGGEVHELARSLASELEGSSTRLIVNDRIDVAMLLGAAGVQLGERSIGVVDARRMLGANALIGRSIHDVDGARQAEHDGADYLLAGHIFETGSKAGQPGRGLDWLHSVAEAVNVPVIAIGGISVERIGPVLGAGAHGVAMGRELLLAKHPAAVARESIEIIKQHTGG